MGWALGRTWALVSVGGGWGASLMVLEGGAAAAVEGSAAALLRFIAKGENVVGAQTVVGRQAQAYGATHFGYFLNDGVVLEIPETGTAIFMRYQYAHQAQLAHGSKSIYGKMLCFVPRHYMGANVLLGKITGSSCYVQRGF